MPLSGDSENVFHSALVTSALAALVRSAEHGQGGGGVREPGQSSANCFVVKILTSNPLALTILQRRFAKPAPVAASRGGWGEGYPTPPHHSQNRTSPRKRFPQCSSNFFSGNFHNAVNAVWTTRQGWWQERCGSGHAFRRSVREEKSIAPSGAALAKHQPARTTTARSTESVFPELSPR